LVDVTTSAQAAGFWIPGNQRRLNNRMHAGVQSSFRQRRRRRNRRARGRTSLDDRYAVRHGGVPS